MSCKGQRGKSLPAKGKMFRGGHSRTSIMLSRTRERNSHHPHSVLQKAFPSRLRNSAMAAEANCDLCFSACLSNEVKELQRTALATA